MKSLRLFFLSVLIFIAISGVFAQTGKPWPKTMLWRISGKGMKKPSYLFGTMHLKAKRIFYFGDSLYHAIANTNGLAIELNPEEVSAELVKSFSTKDTSALLKEKTSHKLYEKVKKKLEKKFGIKIKRLTMRQAFLAKDEWMNEMQRKDDMQSFMDAYLFNIARQLGKWTGGIEDINDQFSLIEKEEKDFSPEVLLSDPSLLRSSLSSYMDTYIDQDLEKLYEYTKQMSSSYRQLVLNQRNIKMARRIDSLMKLRAVFFAVGAAHLPGDSGVITFLRKQGYQVEPVFSSKKIAPEDYQYQVKHDFWKKFYPADSIYSIRYPGASSTMYAAEDLVKMQMCIDLPTACFYLSTGIPNLRRNENRDKLLEEMLMGFYKQGKVIDKTKSEENGVKSIDVIIERESGGYSRVKAYITDNYAFMIAMGHDSKKEAVTNADAEFFFSSFKIEPNAYKSGDDWKLYSNSKLAFSVLMPKNPDEKKEEVENDWIVNNYTVLDLKSQVYYMVNVKSSAEGFYLSGDSNYFSQIKEIWAESGFQKLKEENLQIGDYTALKYDMLKTEGRDKIITRTLTVNRGSRSYMLVAATQKGNENNVSIERFFNSFRLNDYSSAAWKTHRSPDGIYTAYTPGTIKKKNLKKEENDDDSWVYQSYDSTTAVTYEMQPLSFVDYYYGATDSAVFHDALNALKEYSDSVLVKKSMMNGKYKSQEVVLELKNTQLKRRIRLIWNGDTVYAAYAFVHPSIMYAEPVNRYFDEFTLNGPAIATTLNNKKTGKLLADLTSGDSARFTKAAQHINQVDFEKDDLPLLKEALLKKYDHAEEDFSNIYNTIADAIYTVNDSSIQKFIAKEYFSVRVDNTAQMVAMLRLLAQTKTSESYATLKDLLLSRPPQTNYLYPLRDFLTDSLPLAVSLFPEIMRLSNDSNYYNFTAIIANELLDSNSIQPTVIKPFESNLLKIAQEAYSKMKKVEADNLWNYNSSLQLLARLNTVAGNQLLMKITAEKNNDFNLILIPELLLNNQQVPPAVTEYLAADKAYRFALYNRLREKKLEARFPQKYNSQKMLAEADVYSMASDEYEVKEMAFLQTKKYVVKGKEKQFYLFKVKVEDGWFLGISGGYATDNKVIGISTEDDIGGIYWDEEYSSKKVDELFKAFISWRE